MHSRLLVSSLPRSLPSLPRSPAPPCLPCVEGRQRAAPHSYEFSPTTAPLQTLHMDVWGPAPVGGTDQERYFLLVVDDYIRYTSAFPLHRKADVSGVLIPWIRATRHQGGEFSSDLLAEFCRDEGIVQSFTLPASPQQNGIAEHRIGLIMEVARTSMIHAAAPHFLWSFVVRYAAHQLNLWPRVSEPETSPTLRWMGKAGDALVFRVWGAISLVRDAKVSKLSSRTLRCVFLGFPTDAPPWQFYHPRSRRVFSSQEVTFDDSVCYYRLHPHVSHPGPAPSGVSQVDPPPLVEPLEVSSDSFGPAEGGDPAADDTAATRRSPRLETPPGFLPRRSSPPPQPAAVDSGAETAGAEPGGAETEGAATGGADSVGPASPSGGGAVGDPVEGPGVGQPPHPNLLETLLPQTIRAWIVRRGSPGGGGYGPAGAGAANLGGTVGAGGTGGTAGTGGAAGAGGAGATSPRGATGAGGAGPTSPGGVRAAGPGGTHTRGAGAAGAGGAIRARGATGAAGSVGTGGTAGTGGAGAAKAGGTACAGGGGGATRAAGTGGAGGTAGARGAGAGGNGGTRGAGATGPGGARTRGTGAVGAGGVTGAGGTGGANGATGTGGAGGSTGARGPGTAGASGAAGEGGVGGAAGAGGAGAAGTALRRPYFYPQPQSSLPPPDLPQLLPGSPVPAPAPHSEVTESLNEHREPETRASTPVRARRVTRPRLPADRGTHGMALRPSSVPQCVVMREPPASSLPHVPEPESDLARAASPTVTRLLATVVTDPDLESYCSVDCPPSVGGELALGSDVLEDRHFELECLTIALPRFASMLLCPEGDPDALDIPTPRSYAEAIAGKHSSQWQTAMDAEMASWKSTGTYIEEVPPPGANIVDGMWIFRVKRPPGSPPAFKAHYVARGFSQRQGRDYELHSLDFSTAFLQGSLHEEIWLRHPPGFIVYVDDLVFATTDTEALALAKVELQERHTCTDLGELRSYLGLQITRDRAQYTITWNQSHMVYQVLQRFAFQFSSPQPTPLFTNHSLSAPPSDEFAEPNGLYPELVGCL
ncbi:unnamed protein product [Closterium sp. NIES-53]